MSTIVVMPGGFHPFHAGHASLYQSALKAFPGADVYVAATDSQKERPFPFAIKEKLAKLAGVAPGHFIQVKSPFKAEEITRNYDPNSDVLIFVRSEKDKTEQPIPGGTKKDGTPSYFQPYTGKDLQPFSKHAYIAYLPTIEFGPGITSASEIRAMWPKLNDKRKTAMVMSLYPAAQKNPALAANVVKLLDAGMGIEAQELDEKINKEIFTPDWEEHSTILDGKYNIVAKIKYYGTIPNLFIQVFDPESESKEPIAYVRFRITGMLWWKNLEAGMVHVVQRYRRQGIATALYQYARKLGNTIKPSTAQLPDGKGLWQGLNAKGSLAEKMKMGATIEPIEESNITKSLDYLEEK